MGRRFLLALVMCFAPAAFPAAGEPAQPRAITLASSTAAVGSGIYQHLLPMFERKTGIAVRVLAVGSENALEMAREGKADVVITHDPDAELAHVKEGFGISYHRFMYSEFILVGPKSDPAKAAGRDVVVAMRRILERRAPFESRGGSGSGTHVFELGLWGYTGRDLAREKGPWYSESGVGQEQSLALAVKRGAYTLVDRGTFLRSAQRGDLQVIVEGDRRLLNQFGVMLVNPLRHPLVNRELGQAFIDWLISEEGQHAISTYRVGGEQIFRPNAIR